MPKVGNKHYSYDPKGIAMAKNAAKASGKPMNMMHGGKVRCRTTLRRYGSR